MFLSIVKPDLTQVNAARAILNEQDMHRNVQALFGTDRKSNNVLYRYIPSKDCRRSLICIQSDIEPVSTVDFQVISCNDASDRIQKISRGMYLEFDVLLRPVKRHEGKSAIIRESDLRMQWVKDLGRRYGFGIKNVKEMSRIQKKIFHTATKAGRIDGWRYVGELVVKDENKFKQACITGIGRDKAYGYGMLMLKFKD